MNEDHIKNVIEGALLAAGRPLPVDELLALFEEREQVDCARVRGALQALEQDCQSRGVQLKEVASGFRLQVKPQLSPWISRLWVERPSRYSRALLETLALIAYRQPITRGEIEDIRGVSVSTSIMKTLQEREWVRVVGHRDVPGKPAMYATTKQFLDYFNLKSLDELPTLAELRDIDNINAELDLQFPGGEEAAETGHSDGPAPETPEGEAPARREGSTEVVADGDDAEEIWGEEPAEEAEEGR
ncbi:MAG: SMC-Scp complex subunit ScpB [Gammaproteobacteria bacterium]|nr:SMC-Scp complex subunit ScpB [Gammaproteobacteria bacterium]NIR96548.1 SMC-Scp complex subunit ScpB [Gammaproteobacteria bacterium]NIT62286.1 SMC-Scp complex subunit ScpB [Gammaproteobacteria bacterium]NIV19190.1 SMC-Scp complex subunit ScpB [Gammaproteobacteria bacterium]NIX10058.1 SMC-Scp complex subunit ScpB [Gammaproteobacteria bacterium]